MIDATDTIELDNGYKGYVFFDPEPMNPRTEYDTQIATIIYDHDNYILGDEQVSADRAVPAIVEMCNDKIAKSAELVCLKCGKDVEEDVNGWYHVPEETIMYGDDDDVEYECEGEYIRPNVKGVLSMDEIPAIFCVRTEHESGRVHYGFYDSDGDVAERFGLMLKSQEGRVSRIDGIKKVTLMTIDNPDWKEIPWTE